jgi:hypothetical protein
MRLKSKLFALLGSIALVAALAVPALAKTHPTHPSHPTHPAHPAHGQKGMHGDKGKKGEHGHKGKPHKCAPHQVAYIAHGTLVSFSATPGTDGRYSGTIVVSVMRANHHARSTKGTQATFTLNDTRVRLAKGLSAPAAGDRVTVVGKITAVAKRCSDQSMAGTVTVRYVVISPPAK